MIKKYIVLQNLTSMKKLKIALMVVMTMVLAGVFTSCKRDEKIVEVEKEVIKEVENIFEKPVEVDNAYSRYLKAIV